jgi:hypothetical protein
MSRFVFNRRTSATFAAAFFTAPLSRAHGARTKRDGCTAHRTENAARSQTPAKGWAAVRWLCAAVIDIRNPVCDCIINEIRICPAVQLIYARVHLHDSLRSARRPRVCIQTEAGADCLQNPSRTTAPKSS